MHIYIAHSVGSHDLLRSALWSLSDMSVLFIRHVAVSLELSFFMAITTSKGHTVSTLRELISDLESNFCAAFPHVHDHACVVASLETIFLSCHSRMLVPSLACLWVLHGRLLFHDKHGHYSNEGFFDPSSQLIHKSDLRRRCEVVPSQLASKLPAVFAFNSRQRRIPSCLRREVLNMIGYPNILSFASTSCPPLFAHSMLFSRLGDAPNTCRHDRPRCLPNRDTWSGAWASCPGSSTRFGHNQGGSGRTLGGSLSVQGKNQDHEARVPPDPQACAMHSQNSSTRAIDVVHLLDEL